MNRLEVTLSKKSEAFAVETRPVTIEGVLKKLPPKSALVELVIYVPFDAKAQHMGRWATGRYAAYVLPASGALRGIDLGEAAPIDEAAKALRLAIAHRSRDVKAVARALDALVMHKLRPLLAGATTLIISPDGELAQVPFEALLDNDGKWLVERYHLSYLSTGRDLVRLSVRPKPPSAPMLLADIDFDAVVGLAAAPVKGGEPPVIADAPRGTRSDDRAFGDLHWGRLNGTAAEADGLTPLTAFSGALVLRRSDATEVALRQVHGPRILHIATPGFFLDDLPALEPTRPGETPQFPPGR